MILVDLHRGHEWCAFLHTDPVLSGSGPDPPGWSSCTPTVGRLSAPAATGVASLTAGRELLSRLDGDRPGTA
ncbi:hypothetical protein GZL_05555 [Streptomyces sp. 769]|nr:hypothetical protein GZL_05555 [Streptomyces sp. 769]